MSFYLIIRLILIFEALILIGLSYWGNWLSPVFTSAQAVLVLIGFGLTICVLFVKRKKVLLSVLSMTTMYLIFEFGITLLYITDVFAKPEVYWLFENSYKTIHFDPIRGVWLTQSPSRFARKTKDTLEYIGTFKGNNQGFPDQDDFAPTRGLGINKRIAVFGDSYTAAQFINKNWPDRVEELFSSHGNSSIELLNFAVDGGGVANWENILSRFIVPEEYEIDGIIFAVFPSNLNRKFTMGDHRVANRYVFGRTESWERDAYPKTLQEALPFLYQHPNSLDVSSDEFERFIQGEWMPYLKPIKPFMITKFFELYNQNRPFSNWIKDTNSGEIKANRVSVQKTSEDSMLRALETGVIPLVRSIKQYQMQYDIPIMVIHIPEAWEVAEKYKEYPDDVAQFARYLNAQLIDGRIAYRLKSKEEIEASWFPYDGHWNQQGSDIFAEYMVDIISEWLMQPDQ